MISFEIRWSTKKFAINLSDEEYSTMTVADLKLKCQELTEIEPQFMKLLAYGAVLKNETELIKDYKIVSGSKVMLMGSKKHIKPSSKVPPPKYNEPIDTRLRYVKHMCDMIFRPGLASYKKLVQKHIEQFDNLSDSDKEKQTKGHIDYGNYLHEELMQLISQLDTMSGATEEQKLERKSLVKDAEAMLDVLEGVKTRLQALIIKD